MLETYILKRKEVELGLVTYDTEEDKFSLVWTYEESNKNLVPLWFSVEKHSSDWGIRYWIADRVVPPDRVNINQILDAFGLTEYDPWEICKKNRGYSVTDNCWLFDPKNPEEWVRGGFE